MSSTNTTGSTNITLQFDLSRNIDAAAQDVQTAISQAIRQLPLNMPTAADPAQSEPGRLRHHLPGHHRRQYPAHDAAG